MISLNSHCFSSPSQTHDKKIALSGIRIFQGVRLVRGFQQTARATSCDRTGGDARLPAVDTGARFWALL